MEETAYWNQYRPEGPYGCLEVRDGVYPSTVRLIVPPKHFKPIEPAYQDVHVRRPQTSTTTAPPRLGTLRGKRLPSCFDGDPRFHSKRQFIGNFCNHPWINTNNCSHSPNLSQLLQYQAEKDPPTMIRLATVRTGRRYNGARALPRRHTTMGRAGDLHRKRDKGHLFEPKTFLITTGALLFACNNPKEGTIKAQCQPTLATGSDDKENTDGGGNTAYKRGRTARKEIVPPASQDPRTKDGARNSIRHS